MPQKEETKTPTNKFIENPAAPAAIEITYYTDPICCWSWAMETQWQQLQHELGGSLNITYKMAGLLPSWKNFNDSVNSIRKPAQMGPEWMHAKHISGVEIDNRIWIRDPPASSFPACIAVKSAEIQSKEFGARYLYLLREAVMLKARNIARTEVLFELAADLSREFPSFDILSFRHDLNGKGIDAFRADWQEKIYRGITRLPTFIIKKAGHTPFILNGFQSYESLKNATTPVDHI